MAWEPVWRSAWNTSREGISYAELGAELARLGDRLEEDVRLTIVVSARQDTALVERVRHAARPATARDQAGIYHRATPDLPWATTRCCGEKA